MKNFGNSLFGRKFRWSFGLLLLTGLSASGSGSASSGGISVSSGYTAGCRDCHTGTSYPNIVFYDEEPWMLINSSDYMYIRIQRTSTSHLTSGFNAWASSGSLSLTTVNYQTNVRLVNGDEVTQSTDQAFSGDYSRFGFEFDAPASTGNVTISAWGNAVNNNGSSGTVDAARLGTISIAICKDTDGDDNYSGPSGCPGTSDCDDNNSNRSYELDETCDGVDNDCDGSIDEGVTNTYYRDLDGDGYGNAGSTTTACSQPTGYVSNSTDCNDSDSARYPGNPEVCDFKDNDCDGFTDEGVLTTYYRDVDGDGYGNASVTTTNCSQPTGYVSNSTDCDDGCGVCNPGETEVCDGVDNDCDLATDESSAADASTWYRDSDSDGYGNSGSTTQACSQPSGYVGNSTDCADGDPARYPGNGELCDGKDNDCSGATAVDVGCDDDNDNHCDALMTTVGTPPTCTAGSNDCDDNDAARYPGNAEICDDKDNDCSGATAIDVGCDSDNDDYCDENMTIVGTPGTCSKGGDDCDDSCITCYPGRTEICDGNDNDCDGNVDEDLGTITCGLGICEATAAGCSGGVPQSCTPGTPGTESCGNVGTDDDCDGDINEISHDLGGDPIYVGDPGCDSMTPGICNPGTYACDGSSLSCIPIIAVGAQTEICDGLDNDCDGATDEGCDDDNDNYCDATMTVVGTPPTCTAGGNDCNDSGAAGGALVNPGADETCLNLGVDNDCNLDDTELESGVHNGDLCGSGASGVCGPGGQTCVSGSLRCVSLITPGTQTETCNGLDDDCDGTADNGLPDLSCGVGACANTAPACVGGGDNICTPGAANSEICDDIDNNCDGFVDEGCDDDNDGYCDSGMTVVGTPSTCASGGGDCDDEANTTYPSASELCDFQDNDCDSVADEVADIALAVCGQGICQRTGTTCEPISCTPGIPETEICDDLDNDCDGVVDEGCDDDADGYCDGLIPLSGTPAVCPLGGDDCDDTVATDYPGATEVCDEVDNDCDGEADEVAEVPLATCGLGVCARVGTTCDPASCAPGLPIEEICDGLDNDCNGLPDDGLPLATCGEGACATQGTSCQPSSCVPLAPTDEICDGVDNDCDTEIDDGCDDDNDGYCDANLAYVSSPLCEFGGQDCDDLNADSWPGAPEICDGGDNDCDGLLDNELDAIVCGVGECQSTGDSCGANGEVLGCTPLEPLEEICDGLDNDCDGVIDNDIPEQTCGVGECMVVIPGCAEGSATQCEEAMATASPEVCDGLDNDCDGRADNDAVCPDGECIAGSCVPSELLDELEGMGGNIGAELNPEEVRYWLESTAGASNGGGASLPATPDADSDGKSNETPDQEGGCAIRRANSGAPSHFFLVALFGAGVLWTRRRRAA